MAGVDVRQFVHCDAITDASAAAAAFDAVAHDATVLSLLPSDLHRSRRQSPPAMNTAMSQLTGRSHWNGVQNLVPFVRGGGQSPDGGRRPMDANLLKAQAYRRRAVEVRQIAAGI